MTRAIRCKRVYDAAADGDGCRILVDRLWPRGVSKEKACIDLWPKALTPSTELRRWFHQDRRRADEFAERYLDELKRQQPLAVEMLAGIDQSVITLISATKNPEAGHVRVLQRFLVQLLEDGANDV